MTAEAKHFLDEFETLPDAAKHEVLVELLRLTNDVDYGDVTDEELRLAASDVFAIHDAEESGE